MPVSFFLQLATRIRRAGIAIINKCDVVPNKNAFLNCDAFTDECVTGDFAARPDACVFLNFNEGSNLRFVTDPTPIKIDESANPNVASKLYVGRYSLMRSSISIHAVTISPAASPTARLIR